MAHQTDVNQVPRNFEVPESRDQVADPVCGAKMLRKDSRHALFRGTEQFHFCSKACRDEFLKPTRRPSRPPGAPRAA